MDGCSMNATFVTKFAWEENPKGFKGKKLLDQGLEENYSTPGGQRGTKLEAIPSLKNYVHKGR